VLISQYQEVLNAIRVPEHINNISFEFSIFISDTPLVTLFLKNNVITERTGIINQEIENGTRVRNNWDEISDNPNPKAPPMPTNSTKSI
jgi:hypothetical protein